MDEQERKQLIKATFNTVAPGYDNPGLAFFARAAAVLPEFFNFRGDERVLDVATGTGQAARALARHVPRGRVTGVDFSAGMLGRAREHAAQQQLHNIEFREMDMQAMAFAPRSFDAANCSFGLFFVEDMEGLLRHIAAQVRPGGAVVACSFYDTSFLPLGDLFFERLEKFGIQRPPVGWKRICTEEMGMDLFRRAGLASVRAERRDLSYTLRDAEQWWDIIWYAGFRGLVNQLAPDALTEFKREHLDDIGRHATRDGIPLSVQIVFTTGRAQA
jgi:ubiquinone/menaquinone biosynthesis C-methylase UbiE